MLGRGLQGDEGEEGMQLNTATGEYSLFDDSAEYDAFTEKFKPKRTTDDCYTPENVYEAVAEWVSEEYHIPRGNMIRPFWPGADYRGIDYPRNCAVVDNPPFSIRAEICAWYNRHGVRFFLFSPSTTAILATEPVCVVAVGIGILYENGAEVGTSFVTNLEDNAMRTAPELHRRLDRANKENQRKTKKELQKYSYPDEIVTAAIAQRWCKYGIDWRLSREDCQYINAMDSQRQAGKSIFGGGYLLSERAAAERAAAERAAAERAAAERWTLSARERKICRELGAET